MWPRMGGHQVIESVILKGKMGCQPLLFSIRHDVNSFFILHTLHHSSCCLASAKSSMVKPVMDFDILNLEPKETSFLYWVMVSVLFCCCLFLKVQLTNTFPLDAYFQEKKGYRIQPNSY